MGGMGKLMDMMFMERLFDQLMKDSLTNLQGPPGDGTIVAVVEFEEDQLEPLPLDGMYLPRIRLTLGEDAPYFQVKVGEQAYQYEKS